MRYIRQEIFEGIGKQGQRKLKKSAAAIVGIGALGSVSAELLARAGIGNLVLIDRDVVEMSNLQRQGLFSEQDLGKPKALQAGIYLKKINSDVKINFFIEDLDFKNIERVIGKNVSLILDCTDNLETRFLINDFSIKYNVPFIYASAVGSKGFLFNVIPNKTPCLRCFLRHAMHLDTCENTGVLNAITRVIPSLQANEAIKILLGKYYERNLLFFDVWKNELLKIQVNKGKNCVCCSNRVFEYLNGKKSSAIIKLCGENLFQIKSKQMDKTHFNALKNKLKRIGKATDFGCCINFSGKMTIFNDGRALIRAKDEKEAKSLYSRFVGI